MKDGCDFVPSKGYIVDYKYRKGLNAMSEQIEIGKITSGPGIKPEKRESWFTLTHCLNGLLLASAAQLLLAFLLYFLAAISFTTIMIEAGISLVLALLARYGGDSGRLLRVLTRALFTVYLLLTIALGGALVIFSLIQPNLGGNEEIRLIIERDIWFTIAFAVLPLLLFIQPALALLARYRRRYDFVLIRVTGILVFILSFLLCAFLLDSEGGSYILTSVTYRPVLFGQEIVIPIAFDNILTRILFCLCSAAFILFSFKIHTIKNTGKET